MNTAFLRYFAAVADSESFTRAAERLHVTQPTLSAGIARLEEQLGARLFERGKRVRLTEAGVRFLPRAQSILAEWRQAQTELRAEQPRQRLCLMTLPDLQPRHIAALLVHLRAIAPQIDPEASEGSIAGIAARLAQGRADAAITELAPEGPAASRSQILYRERFGLGIATGHILANRDRCRAAELSGVPFIWRRQCEQQDRARRTLAELGVRPRVVMRTASEELAAAAVVADLGGCFLPETLMRPGMSFVLIDELALERRIGLVWRADADPAWLTPLKQSVAGVRWGTARPHRTDPALAH